MAGISSAFARAFNHFAVRRVWKFISSIQLAVVVLLGLVAALTTATFLESATDTPTAQYYVYRSGWFSALLGLLGVNIFCSALSRLPWKRRHAAFLAAHVGILMLLAGSAITQRFGTDGTMRIQEEQSSARVELGDEAYVVVMDDRIAHRVALPWLPPGVRFKPFALSEHGIPHDVTVTEFLPHADADIQFVPEAGSKHAALQIVVEGGPMRIRQSYWLWQGDAAWSHLEAGPAIVEFMPAEARGAKHAHAGRPTLEWTRDAGGLRYRAVSSDGKVRTGAFTAAQLGSITESQPLVFDPGWKAVKVLVTRFIPQARAETRYAPSRIEYGTGAPPPAIRIATGEGSARASVWLGLGDRAVLTSGGREIGIGYFPKMVILPFSVRLDRFTVQHYEGSLDPASYASRVTVLGQGAPRAVEISMNEPLHEQGYTLYQASYEDAQPRPVVSIFSVNRDPGRPIKYAGSLIIVAGTLLLFASRFKNRRKAVV